MTTTLGLAESLGDETATSLTGDLFILLHEDGVDYTSFFRSLGIPAREDAETARSMFQAPAAFDAWFERWWALDPDADLMDRTNPVYIPRNHLVEEALGAAVEDELEPFSQLLARSPHPFRSVPASSGTPPRPRKASAPTGPSAEPEPPCGAIPVLPAALFIAGGKERSG